VVSDHGMTGLSQDRALIFENYIDNKTKIVGNGPIEQFWPENANGKYFHY